MKANQKLRQKVYKYMIENKEVARDLTTGEINCTALADLTAAEFNLYDSDLDVLQWVDDLAVDVAEEEERK